MADGNQPPPPLSPHEEGEKPNTKTMNQQPPFPPQGEIENSTFLLPPPPPNEHHTIITTHPLKLSLIKQTNQPPLHGLTEESNAQTNWTLIGSHKIPFNQCVIPEENATRSSVVGLKLSHFASSSNRYPFFYQDKPKVVFQKSDKAKLIAGMNNILIAKFSHGQPSVLMMQTFLSSRKLIGKFHVSFFDAKHIFIEFECFVDFVKFWIKQKGFIHGFPVRFFKWDELFDPSKESSIIPVWIHLPRLPLYLFEEGAILLIACALGRPLHIDVNNLNRNKIGYATVCIELDILKVPPCDIWIQFGEGTSDGKSAGCCEGFLQKVVYGFMPSFCSSCSHIGHQSLTCKRYSLGAEIKKPSVQNMVLHDEGHLPIRTVLATDDRNLLSRAGLTNVEVSTSEAMKVLKEGELDGKFDHTVKSLYGKEVQEGVKEVGAVKGIKQLAGMLANPFVLAAKEEAQGVLSNETMEHTQTPSFSRRANNSEAALQEVTKNCFAALEEEVLVQDITLEEGEFAENSDISKDMELALPDTDFMLADMGVHDGPREKATSPDGDTGLNQVDYLADQNQISSEQFEGHRLQVVEGGNLANENVETNSAAEFAEKNKDTSPDQLHSKVQGLPEQKKTSANPQVRADSWADLVEEEVHGAAACEGLVTSVPGCSGVFAGITPLVPERARGQPLIEQNAAETEFVRQNFQLQETSADDALNHERHKVKASSAGKASSAATVLSVVLDTCSHEPANQDAFGVADSALSESFQAASSELPEHVDGSRGLSAQTSHCLGAVADKLLEVIYISPPNSMEARTEEENQEEYHEKDTEVKEYPIECTQDFDICTLQERIRRLRGEEPYMNVVRPPGVDAYAKEEMDAISSTPSKETNFDPEYSDVDGSTVTWSQLMSRSLKVLTTRSLSPVSRSSKKMSKLRKKVEYINYDEGTAVVIEQENYNELDEFHNANLRQRVSAYKEQRKASSQVDVRVWSPAQRRSRKGRNKNMKSSFYN